MERNLRSGLLCMRRSIKRWRLSLLNIPVVTRYGFFVTLDGCSGGDHSQLSHFNVSCHNSLSLNLYETIMH